MNGSDRETQAIKAVKKFKKKKKLYIYIYIERERERERGGGGSDQNGVSRLYVIVENKRYTILVGKQNTQTEIYVKQRTPPNHAITTTA